MANNQVIQLDGILSDVENTEVQTESSNTFIQLSDRYDYAIDSSLNFGSPTTIFITYPDSIESTLVFEVAQLNTTIFATSIESTIGFGDNKPQFRIFTNSIVNELSFGNLQLNSIVYANSVENDIEISSPSVRLVVGPVPIVSNVLFGNSQINMQIEDAPFPSIDSTLVISNPSVRFVIGPLGIAPTNNFGTATFIDNIHRVLVFKDDNISKVSDNDAVVIAGGIRVNPSSSGSKTATSGNAILPSNPVGFISVNIGGTDYMMPYYNP